MTDFNSSDQEDAASTTTKAAATDDELLSRVGQIARTLHDNLRALGLDKVIQNAARDIPDVRERLNYVVSMTEQAAQRVLNATDMTIPLQEQIIAQCGTALRECDTAECRAVPGHEKITLALQQINANADISKQQLIDIMMAQDFQDLTGQVIRRITELAHNLETQLVQLLLDYAPVELRKETSGLLNGPQINPHAEDVVSDQGQVDDLLSSLGF